MVIRSGHIGKSHLDRHRLPGLSTPPSRCCRFRRDAAVVPVLGSSPGSKPNRSSVAEQAEQPRSPARPAGILRFCRYGFSPRQGGPGGNHHGHRVGRPWRPALASFQGLPRSPLADVDNRRPRLRSRSGPGIAAISAVHWRGHRVRSAWLRGRATAGPLRRLSKAENWIPAWSAIRPISPVQGIDLCATEMPPCQDNPIRPDLHGQVAPIVSRVRDECVCGRRVPRGGSGCFRTAMPTPTTNDV